MPKPEQNPLQHNKNIQIYLPDISSPSVVNRQFYQVLDLIWEDDGVTHSFDLITTRNWLTSEILLPDDPAVQTLIQHIEVEHQLSYECATDLFRIHVWRVRYAGRRFADFQSQEAYGLIHSLAKKQKRIAFVAADGGAIPTEKGEEFVLDSGDRYIRVQTIIDELSTLSDRHKFRYDAIYFMACNPKNMPVTATRIPVIVHTDINDLSTGNARVYYP